jgi:hypothetical protein
MNDIRCPRLDKLAHRLIDAYRQREDLAVRAHTPVELSKVWHQIALLHEMITDHRFGCTFCRQFIVASQRTAQGLEPSREERGTAIRL